jgi:DNA ligase-1
MKAGNYLDIKTKKPQYSPVGYYMTEKFDGSRAQWDPRSGQLVSRYGNVVIAPQWFLDFFKDIKIPLDGEIFFGYGNWGMTGICRAKSIQAQRDNEPLWNKANYLVFDLPDTERGTYMERIAQLEKCPEIGVWGDKFIPIWLIPRKLVTDRTMLETYYKKIIDRGGEGIIMNNPEAFYCDGRTDNILKYKPILDNECVIVDYKPGNGRNAGRLGAFIVHPIEDGVPDPKREFSISGMSDLVRSSYKSTHPIGAVLRYCCTEYTKNGKPRFPRYLGICKKPVTKEQEQQAFIGILIPDPKSSSITEMSPSFKIRAKLKTGVLKNKIRVKLRPNKLSQAVFA